MFGSWLWKTWRIRKQKKKENSLPLGDHFTQVAARLILKMTKSGFHLPAWNVHTYAFLSWDQNKNWINIFSSSLYAPPSTLAHSGVWSPLPVSLLFNNLLANKTVTKKFKNMPLIQPKKKSKQHIPLTLSSTDKCLHHVHQICKFLN